MSVNKINKIAICVENGDYEVSLEKRKIYQVLVDEKAKQVQMIRIIDESGEDYLYPEKYFMILDLPEVANKLFAEI